MRTALDSRVAIGLAIAAALGLADLVGILAPPPDLGQALPWAATLFVAVTGAMTLVAVGVVVWSTTRDGTRNAQRIALWTVVASRVASVLVAVPSTFLVGLTTPLVAWIVVTVAVTVVALVLIITGTMRDAPVP